MKHTDENRKEEFIKRRNDRKYRIINYVANARTILEDRRVSL